LKKEALKKGAGFSYLFNYFSNELKERHYIQADLVDDLLAREYENTIEENKTAYMHYINSDFI